MVLGLLAGVGLPLLLKATGADKEIEKGLRTATKSTKKALGFKKGGLVQHTGKALVHKGEYVLPKATVDKLRAEAKRTAKPKAKPKPKPAKKKSK